jgi:L-lactate dehydrogenase
MPAVVGRKGIIKVMPIQFDEEERVQLETCAKGLRGVIEGAEKELSADRALENALANDNGS